MKDKKIIFILLCLGEDYSKFSLHLIRDLLEKTPFDIQITTDCPHVFTPSDRIIVKQADLTGRRFNINYSFNYNLKYLAFADISSEYEYVFYFDCDQQVVQFNTTALKELLDYHSKNGYDYIAARTNAVLRDSLERFKRGENELFTHKILNFNLDKVDPPDSWLRANMISEHFFILKNDKIKAFYETWRDLNAHTEALEECHGTWGDGFEIGVAAAVAGYTAVEASSYDQYEVMGIVFNGHKYRTDSV